MLDIFVVALLASLAARGALATIIPGAGALAFASVVVMTMLASLSFDPRLLGLARDPEPSSIELPESDNARSR
jgi:paraquat-inducible protein A